MNIAARKVQHVVSFGSGGEGERLFDWLTPGHEHRKALLTLRLDHSPNLHDLKSNRLYPNSSNKETILHLPGIRLQ